MLLMSKETLDIDGTAPCDEDSVPVIRDTDYMPEMRAQANRYKEMLEVRFPEAPGYFKICRNPHDFGTYLTLGYVYDDSDEVESEWAFFIEANLPNTWDDIKVLKWEPTVEKE